MSCACADQPSTDADEADAEGAAQTIGGRVGGEGGALLDPSQLARLGTMLVSNT